MLIDGRKIAGSIQSEIHSEVVKIIGRKPCLAVILIGENPASQIYVKRKIQACESVEIKSIRQHYDVDVSEKELLNRIEEFNQDPTIDGILIQLPLPSHINSSIILRSISPEKDIDGFHPINVGKLLIGDIDGFVPCTPLGIKVLLERYGINVSGKHAVIIGRSNIVGKPMAALLMQNSKGANATVTIAHSRTSHLKELCLMADILIVAIGLPNFIKEDMVKENAVVIDVGMNRINDISSKNGYRLVGDVDFNTVEKKCSFITPVPGGVGPMTIAMLLHNTLNSYKKRIAI